MHARTRLRNLNPGMWFDGEALRRARTELGLSQEQLAERLGVDVRSYRRYETGQVNDPAGGFQVRHAARRRFIDQACRELGLEESELLVERPPAAAPAARRAGHPLPPARHFVGRAALLGELLEWARAEAPAVRVTALVAAGGAGKTSVCGRLLESLPAFAWSFYEDPRAEAFLGEAGRAFSARADEPPVEALLRALGAGPPHLLVLDGLELLQADGAGARARGELLDPLLRRLLRGIAAGAGGTRALVGSRFELADLAPWEGSAARSIRLEPLAAVEAEELLRRWGVQGPPEELARLVTELGGHALAVAVAGSYAAGFLEGRAAPLLDLTLAEAAGDDPLARRLGAVLRAYADALPPLEKELLARLALFPGGVDPAALQALGADPAALTRGLSRLRRLGLVHAGASGVLLHPLLGAWCREALGGPSEAVHRLEEQRLAALLAGRPDAGPAEDAVRDDLAEALVRQALLGGRAREAFQVYARVLGGFGRLGLRAGAMARGARVLAGFAKGGDPSRLTGLDPDLAAAVAYDWGLYAEALGDLALALRCFEAHERALREQYPEERSGAHALATSWRARAYVLRLQGRLDQALAAADRARSLAEAAASEFHLCRALALEAVILHDLGEERAAVATFARAREVEGRAPEARRALWEAEHLAGRGEREAARELARATAEDCAARGWEGHAAQARALLGRLAVDEAPAEAAEHLAVARAWAARSGEVEALLRARALAAALHLAERRPVEAAGEARAGLELVESTGARWFERDLAVLLEAARR